MKKSLISMAALLAVLVGCNKELQQDTPADVDGKVYMQFSVNMLTTRSGTDETGNTNSNANPDYEVGKDTENKISKVDVVLSNGTQYVVADNVVPAQASTDTYVASFSSLALSANATYNVYIYANCEAPTTLQLDAVSNATIEEITTANNFWMTNAYAATPVTLPSDLSLHTQPQNPLNLGSHYVERTMARFDYMAVKEGNVYPIQTETVTGEGEDAVTTTKTVANIKLTDIALINMSNSFYMFRRVSADGTNANWSLGGVEIPTNYVVDTDYEAKANGWAAGLEANFTHHMSAPTSWDWDSLADLTADDNWTGAGTGDHNPSSYKIWRYAKENTIPNVNAQDHGITTGVVFKGEIQATNDAPQALKTAMTAGTERIYVFENELIGTWAMVQAAATAADAKATLAAAYNQVTAGLAALGASATEAQKSQVYAGAGFTGYTPVGGKYYAYYYYWNRHNDNKQPYTMGVMEFAVVRNNVYKLCVDNIVRFGHPTPGGTDPDPDPELPEEPDESVNYYFNVTVKVLPWVVRVNHIEF